MEANVCVFRRIQTSEREMVDRRTGIVHDRDPFIVGLVEDDQLRRQLDVRHNVLDVIHAAVAQNHIDVPVAALGQSLRSVDVDFEQLTARRHRHAGTLA